jgi:hypothetical protein
MKLKMVATAGFSLTLDPIGKMFPSASDIILMLLMSKVVRVVNID